MFKDKYTKDNLNITPDESVKRYIRSKLAEEEKHPRPRINKNAVIAAVLSLCLAVGVVAVSHGTGAVQTLPQTAGDMTLKDEVTYGEIYASITTLLKKDTTDPGNGIPRLFSYLYSAMGGAKDTAVPETATDGNAGAMGDPADSGSSTTNNQVQGVDEADIVKNDGRYIYSLRYGSLSVTDSNSGNPILVSTRQVTHYNEVAQNMFVNGNKLAVILSYYGQGSEVTRLRIFNIENKSNVYEVSTLEQSGYYSEARMIGDTVYLLSNHRVTGGNIQEDKPEGYVPCIDDKAIAAGDISMIENFTSLSYLVITAIDIPSGECTTSEAVLGGAENVYADADSLYYTFSNHVSEETEGKARYQTNTTVVKLALGTEDITTVATATVEGRPLNQFSMDEYEGNLRIVTTTETTVHDVSNVSAGTASTYYVSNVSTSTKNALYVLDEKLNIIGRLEDLAKDERVYSVRFDGNIGYFVTFRQVDPLFTVDLSDPASPIVLSELKIPGFSEYLHPFGEGLLFGFGKSATDEGAVTGLKISMFDVSDPAAVTEDHVTPIDASWSEASSNHKAIMVDAGKNIIAFVAADDAGVSRMYVYGYSADTGFFLKGDTVIDSKYSYNSRFVWIGDFFYLVTESDITAFSMTDFTQTAFLRF